MFLLTLICYITMKTLFTFNNAPDVEPWYTENDVVMGGVSSSQITHTEEEGIGGVARFTGNVSLEITEALLKFRTIRRRWT